MTLCYSLLINVLNSVICAAVQEITGDVLLELNMNSLKELDIPTFGKRFKLHTAINALREECGYLPTNRMSVTSSTYSTDSRFIQQKSPTSSSTSPSSARYSNPIYTRHSASYHSNLVNLEKQHQRRRSHTSLTNEGNILTIVIISYHSIIGRSSIPSNAISCICFQL